MIETPAFLYDGQSSEREEVRLAFYPAGHVHIVGPLTDVTLPLSEVDVSPRIANTPRSIYLPGGAKCEAPDNDAIDEALASHGLGRGHAFVHRLESSIKYVVIAVIVAIAASWGLVQFGTPALAKRVAYALPVSADAAAGRDALKALDRMLFAPSDIPEKRQQELLAVFHEIANSSEVAAEPHLQFRRSDRIGPNALALPSGVVIVTDALVSLAKHDDELRAVFAHELGHVANRHTLRRLMQNAAVALVIASISGDLTSITALAAGMPTLLLETKYSRAFELEADKFALEYLDKNEIARDHFVRILTRLDEETGQGGGAIDYLASHPATSDRVKAIRRQQ